MSYESLPSRLDIDLVARTDVPLEFTIMSAAGARDITNDTITMDVRDEYGGQPLLTKTNLPGQHSDPLNGKTIFTLSALDTKTTGDAETWLYEIGRLYGGGQKRVHIVGELRVYPSLAT